MIRNTYKRVRLQSGGLLTISANIDLFALSVEDREFVIGLLKALEDYANDRALTLADNANRQETLNEHLLETAKRIGGDFDWRVILEIEPQLIHRFQETSIAPGLHKMCKDGVLLKTKEGKTGPRGYPPRYRIAPSLAAENLEGNQSRAEDYVEEVVLDIALSADDFDQPPEAT